MTIRILLAETMEMAASSHAYDICGIRLETDLDLACLKPFESSRESLGLPEASPPRAQGLATDRPCGWRTSGLVAGRVRGMDVATQHDGARMRIESVGEFVLSPDGSRIRLDRRVPDARTPEIVECALGAPLILSFALRGRWLLHASAVRCAAGAVAFAGDSGSGKSTLAAHLDADSAMRRITDDMFCYAMIDSSPHAVPAFPQLKLAPGQQYAGAPEPLAAIVVLQPTETEREPAIRALQGSDKLLAVLQHGVASRVFPRNVLTNHFNSCSQLVEKTEVFQVYYPLSAKSVARLQQWLTQRFSRN